VAWVGLFQVVRGCEKKGGLSRQMDFFCIGKVFFAPPGPTARAPRAPALASGLAFGQAYCTLGKRFFLVKSCVFSVFFSVLKSVPDLPVFSEWFPVTLGCWRHGRGDVSVTCG
jgi:hypothetical protein